LFHILVAACGTLANRRNQTMATLEKAIAIAVKAHTGHIDKAGGPYILHPLRVMLAMATQTEQIAAVLHDVIEDSPMTIEDLRREGFDEQVLAIVDALTRRPGESYADYIQRVGAHPPAIAVKLADLRDNMDFSRLATVTDQDMQRLARYHRAYRLLVERRSEEKAE